MIEGLQGKITDKILLNSKVSKEDLDKIFQLHKSRGGSLTKLLASEGVISEEELMVIISQELNIPPINLSRVKIDPDVLKLIPERMAHHYNIIPVSKMGDRLTIAVSDPLNVLIIDQLKNITTHQIDLIVATEADIAKAIKEYYSPKKEMDVGSVLDSLSKEAVGEIIREREEDLSVHSLTQESEAAPIIKMVDLLIIEAMKRNASDIHIEPTEDDVRIRYRIDGKLQEVFTLPKKNQHAILARVKIMSKLDITENRVPQDGRFKIKLDEKEIDFRVSVLPISHGGKVVLRLLDKSNLGVGIESLGFLPESLEVFRKALARPFGMILITGPTGSGKSTTLYSVINKLNSIERNIITVEDPVEYQIDGITQVQAKPEIGLTFASGLRSLLRQSPDVVLIGEIRDSETADIAIKASLTGQIVLSTLHTNDAIGAITRLMDMGVEPFLVAASLVMVGAQRLCRKLCDNCKKQVDIKDEVLKDAGIDLSLIEGGQKFYGPSGCDMCGGSGYRGRRAVLEAFLLDSTTREMIISGATLDAISDYAKSHGMKTLKDNVVHLFCQGVTSLEEVLRVTGRE